MLDVIKTLTFTGAAKLTDEKILQQDLLAAQYKTFRGSVTLAVGGATSVLPGHFFNMLLAYTLRTPKGGLFVSACNGFDLYKAFLLLFGEEAYWTVNGVKGATPPITAGAYSFEVCIPTIHSTRDKLPWLVPELFHFNTLYEQATFDLQESPGLTAIYTGAAVGSTLTGAWEIANDLVDTDYQVAHGLPTILKANYPTDGQVQNGVLRAVGKGMRAPQGVNLKVSATSFNNAAIGNNKFNIFNNRSTRGLIGAVLDVRTTATGVLADNIENMAISVNNGSKVYNVFSNGTGETIQDFAALWRPGQKYQTGLYFIDFRSLLGSPRTGWADASDLIAMDIVTGVKTAVSNVRLTTVEASPRATA